MGVYKHISGGLFGETVREVNGQEFMISTSKKRQSLVSTYCEVKTKKDVSGRVVMSQHTMQDLMDIKILSSVACARVTVKQITEQHNNALILFDRMVSEGKIQPEPKLEPQIGTIIFLEGYGHSKGSRGNEHIVYAIEETSFGTDYKTIERSTLKLDVKDHVRHISKLFGIGLYFDESYSFEGTKEELDKLVFDALAAQQHIEEENARIEQEKQSALEEEKKQLLKAYHFLTPNPSSDNKITKANLIALLKERFPKVKFSVRKDNHLTYYIYWENGPTQDQVKEVSGCFVGYGFDETGDYYDYTPSTFNKLFGDFKFIFHSRKESEAAQEPTTSEEVSNASIELIEYNERSVAVIGDTKPIKDTLKSLGGRFNFRLSCGAGWIFPMSKKEELISALNL